jgi:DNA-binding response OmpR family regulator
MKQRILVVDDEPDLLELVRVNLAQGGFEVDRVVGFEIGNGSTSSVSLLAAEAESS